MSREEDEDILWDAEMRGLAQLRQRREWALLSPDCPDATYDANNGWTLVQFAMHFEPESTQLYKQQLRAYFNRPLVRCMPHLWSLTATSQNRNTLANAA